MKQIKTNKIFKVPNWHLKQYFLNKAQIILFNFYDRKMRY